MESSQVIFAKALHRAQGLQSTNVPLELRVHGRHERAVGVFERSNEVVLLVLHENGSDDETEGHQW